MLFSSMCQLMLRLFVGRLVTSKCYADYVGVSIILAAASGGSCYVAPVELCKDYLAALNFHDVIAFHILFINLLHRPAT